MPNTIVVKDGNGTNQTINTNDFIGTLIGEVQATPTANTLLGRLKDLADLLNSLGATLVSLFSTATRVNSSALEASRVLKASAGTLWTLIGYNHGAGDQFIQIFDSATVPADGTAPVAVFRVASGNNFSIDLPRKGLPCANGISVCNSSTPNTKTIGGADCWFTAVIQ